MFEWLKGILGEAYSEEIDKQVAQEIGKAFVSREDFNAKNESAKALSERLSEANKTIEDMKANAPDIDSIQTSANEWRAKAEQIQKDLQDAEAKYQLDIAKRDSRAQTEKLLSDKKFINMITREHFINAVENALDDPANKGKGREEIFKELTEKDGKPIDEIFLTENPNKIVGPAPGADVPRGEIDPIQAKIDKYKKK